MRASEKEVAPAGFLGSRPPRPGPKGVSPMATVSLAHPAQESLQTVECFRHEGEECPRCDGSGFRPAKLCEECGERAGSVSEGTGFPLVRDKESGSWFHVHCNPRRHDLDGVWSGLERMRAARLDAECLREISRISCATAASRRTASRSSSSV